LEEKEAGALQLQVETHKAKLVGGFNPFEKY